MTVETATSPLKQLCSKCSPLLASILLLFSGTFGIAGTCQKATQAPLRLIVETDIGGDADDQGTLVRLLLYACDFDIEGIILCRGPEQFGNDPIAWNPTGAADAMEMTMDYLDAYEAAYSNLIVHDPNYPGAGQLRQVVKAGWTDAGEQLIVEALRKDDNRPVWYLNWGANDGSVSSLRRVLDKLHKGAIADVAYDEAIRKLRYVEAYMQNHLGNVHSSRIPFYMDTFMPNMDGGRWYHRWSKLTSIETFLKERKNRLCSALYSGAKEGDTMAWMHLVPNGINIPEQPGMGGWSGRYRLASQLPPLPSYPEVTFGGWVNDQQDTWQGTKHRDNTLKRWGGGDMAEDIRNDFKVRALWADHAAYEDCNHPPVVCVEGNTNPYLIQRIAVQPGALVTLSAAGSRDPDAGQSLAYQWTWYDETDNYTGNLNLKNADTANCTVQVPDDFQPGQELNLYVRVVDDGDIPLARYGRVLLHF